MPPSTSYGRRRQEEDLGLIADFPDYPGDFLQSPKGKSHTLMEYIGHINEMTSPLQKLSVFQRQYCEYLVHLHLLPSWLRIIVHDDDGKISQNKITTNDHHLVRMLLMQQAALMEYGRSVGGRTKEPTTVNWWLYGWKATLREGWMMEDGWMKKTTQLN
jgi:hypothetical protein